MEKLTQLLSSIADYLVYDLFGLAETSLFSNALHYFLIGFTEIVILLLVLDTSLLEHLKLLLQVLQVVRMGQTINVPIDLQIM